MTSGNLNDGKAAIPLLKKMGRDLPAIFSASLFDAGYDFKAVYQQVMNQNLQAVIPYNPRGEGECISQVKSGSYAYLVNSHRCMYDINKIFFRYNINP